MSWPGLVSRVLVSLSRGTRGLYQVEDLIYSLLWYSMVFDVNPTNRGERVVDLLRNCLSVSRITVEKAIKRNDCNLCCHLESGRA